MPNFQRPGFKLSWFQVPCIQAKLQATRPGPGIKLANNSTRSLVNRLLLVEPGLKLKKSDQFFPKRSRKDIFISIFFCSNGKRGRKVQGWFVLINFYFYWLSSWGDKLLKGHQKVVRNNLKNVTLPMKKKRKNYWQRSSLPGKKIFQVKLGAAFFFFPGQHGLRLTWRFLITSCTCHRAKQQLWQLANILKNCRLPHPLI